MIFCTGTEAEADLCKCSSICKWTYIYSLYTVDIHAAMCVSVCTYFWCDRFHFVSLAFVESVPAVCERGKSELCLKQPRIFIFMQSWRN